MVDIKPFRAIRYETSKIGELAAVIAPPYDVISPAQQDQLYAQHEANIVRVDLNKKEPGDGELAPYERAQRLLEDWLARGLLVTDELPAYYVLSQTFVGPDGVERTRTGFFGRARLSPFGDGPILPHERTLTGPKLDRLRLFRSTKTNLSPIFGMFQDPREEVLGALRRATARAPDMQAEMSGVKNRLWRITDPAQVEQIRAALEPKKLYIADGHHRYETGLAYRDERRKAAGGASTGEEGYESILMFSAAVEDPGMVVFPTHRLVHGLPGLDEAKVLGALDRYFTRKAAPEGVEALTRALAEAGQRTNAFAMVTPSGRWLLEAKKDAPFGEVPPLPKHDALRRLDVAILHAVILEHILGISKEAQASQTHLRYSKDAQEAASAPTREAEVQIAFLMNPTKVSEVIAVAEAGEVMPQKSTFFYPKIPSGLVLYPLD